MLKRLVNFHDKNDILNDNPFGFRSGRSHYSGFYANH